MTEEEQHEALTFMWWGGPLLIAISVAPWAILAIVLHVSGFALPYLAFLVTFAAVTALYYVGYESMHFLMHMPSVPIVERTRVFEFIKRHHRIHHVHMNRNLNVLLPLADLVLGTLVTEMPAPSTTPEGARRLARRHSKFGRRIS